MQTQVRFELQNGRKPRKISSFFFQTIEKREIFSGEQINHEIYERATHPPAFLGRMIAEEKKKQNNF